MDLPDKEREITEREYDINTMKIVKKIISSDRGYEIDIIDYITKNNENIFLRQNGLPSKFEINIDDVLKCIETKDGQIKAIYNMSGEILYRAG